MKRADVSLFPILVKLQAKKCVVVGAGKIAAGKAAGLLASGAQVIVIGPRAVDWIRSQARVGKLIWRRRRFLPADMDQAFLVIAATNSNATNEAVYRACVERAVLCNVVDDPEHCDFFYPAVVRRGPLQIAISTDGRSPALARRLRIELERQFGPEYGAWVERVGELRRGILRRNLNAGERRHLLDQIASYESFEQFLRNRSRTMAKNKRK
jgi:precorrin-2 dehydrogenase/sirohydrochlorin ferrochelatase